MAIYKDFDISFAPDPYSGDLASVEDDAAVFQSVRTLLATSFYERPFQPGLGSTITQLLFEPNDKVTHHIIATNIKDVVDQYEPRCKVEYVDVFAGTGPDDAGNLVTLDDHEVVVRIALTILNRPNLAILRVSLKRLR